MKNLTYEEIEESIYSPVFLASYYSDPINIKTSKSIWYYPKHDEYRIFKGGIQINESSQPETALKYYNEIEF